MSKGWIMEVDGPVVTGPLERIAPDGVVGVVLLYRRPFEMRLADVNRSSYGDTSRLGRP